MRLNVLMLLGAIGLSGVAAYYSIIGMTSIFNGTLIPIVIMTGFLESNKLIVASWLYNNWSNTKIALRLYLTIAVVVLMFITSMGIFGFLSKANIEQTARAEEQQAQITHINQQIIEQNAIILQAKQYIANIGNDSTLGDTVINARIADATKVIDAANQRIQPQINEQQHIIDQENSKVESGVKIIQSQIDGLDKQVASLDSIIKSILDQGKIGQAQFKQKQQKVERDQINKQKLQLLKQIDSIRNAPNSAIDSAKVEITKLHSMADNDAKQARDTIGKMTAQLGQAVNTDKVQYAIDQQNQIIKTATDQLSQLNTVKFNLETDSRKLDVEVGPLKYIAQMVYGDNIDQQLLARSVRWVILILIFVFDPLAVLMLIAANQGMMQHRNKQQIIKNNSEQESINSNIIALTTDSEPVTVQYDEPNNVQDDIQDDLENIIVSQPAVKILTTEDLLTSLNDAHLFRLHASNIAINNNNQEQ